MSGSAALIWFFAIVALSLAGVIFLLVRRKSMSFQLVIIQDNRRGVSFTSGKYRYNMRIGKEHDLKAVKIYSRLISFFPERVLTEIADPRPFVWFGRTVFGIIGPTGNMEDDSIVLIPKPKLTSLDVERWAQYEGDRIRTAFSELMAGHKKNNSKIGIDELSSYIKKTFDETWVLGNTGAGNNFVKKDDVLPRSIKVAYSNEIKNTYAFMASHQDLFSKLMQFAPIILLTVFVIGIGIGLNIYWSGQAKATQAQAAYIDTVNNNVAAQSVAIGKALAEAHIYGYNYSPTLLPAPNNSEGGSLVPSLPSTPST